MYYIFNAYSSISFIIGNILNYNYYDYEINIRIYKKIKKD